MIKKLLRVGITLGDPFDKVSFRDIKVAILGDESAEKVRNLKVDADRKEREELEAKGKLFPMDELEKWLLENYIVPMSNILAGAATTLDTRCNPEHPEQAREAIRNWVENEVKPALKAELEKPRK